MDERLPVPNWTRDGETWRVEPEPGGWRVLDPDEGWMCDAEGRRCRGQAVVLRERPKTAFALCARHVREARMWIENRRLVSWRLSR